MRLVAAIKAERLHPQPLSLTEIVLMRSKLLPSGTLDPHTLVISTVNVSCERPERNRGDNALSEPQGSPEHKFEPGL